jgi:hypothetical protein
VPQVDRELDRAWAEYQRRERRQWDLDLSALRGTVTVEGYAALNIRAAERDLLGNSFPPGQG